MMKILFGFLGTPKLICYRGYGSQSSFRLSGHVRSDFKGSKPHATASKVHNVLYFLRTYFAAPYADVQVLVEFEEKEYTTKTDKYGYFEFSFTPTTDIDPDGDEWFELLVSVPEHELSDIAKVLVEGDGNTFGVISDIDDTVLVSDAPHKMKLILNTLGGNAFSRDAFVGVSDWYRSLVQGKDGVSTNPIFYVSSSHWNLYGFLTTFFEQQDMPRGPLLLKDFLGIRNGISEVHDHSHKEKKIQMILDTYQDTEFILIGDSGQRDPRLYTNIVESNPGRIQALYIRDVVQGKDPLVEEAYMRLQKSVPIILFQDTDEAVRDSRARGFIL